MRPSVINNSTNKFTPRSSSSARSPRRAPGGWGAGWAGPGPSRANQSSGEGGGGPRGCLCVSGPRPGCCSPQAWGPARSWLCPATRSLLGKADPGGPIPGIGPSDEWREPPFLRCSAVVPLGAETRGRQPDCLAQLGSVSKLLSLCLPWLPHLEDGEAVLTWQHWVEGWVNMRGAQTNARHIVNAQRLFNVSITFLSHFATMLCGKHYVLFPFTSENAAVQRS